MGRWRSFRASSPQKPGPAWTTALSGREVNSVPSGMIAGSGSNCSSSSLPLHKIVSWTLSDAGPAVTLGIRDEALSLVCCEPLQILPMLWHADGLALSGSQRTGSKDLLPLLACQERHCAECLTKYPTELTAGRDRMQRAGESNDCCLLVYK